MEQYETILETARRVRLERAKRVKEIQDDLLEKKFRHVHPDDVDTYAHWEVAERCLRMGYVRVPDWFPGGVAGYAYYLVNREEQFMYPAPGFFAWLKYAALKVHRWNWVKTEWGVTHESITLKGEPEIIT